MWQGNRSIFTISRLAMATRSPYEVRNSSLCVRNKTNGIGSQDRQHMLALTLQSCATLRSLAEHIDARGGHIRFTLYSVDLLPEQQYLTTKRLTIGSAVRLYQNQLLLHDQEIDRRAWRCCRLEVVLERTEKHSVILHQATTLLLTPCDSSGMLRVMKGASHLTTNVLSVRLSNGFTNTIRILFSRYVGIRRLFHIFLHISRPRVLFSV